MKNNYRKLKITILFQTLLVTAITLLVGFILWEFVVDGASDGVVRILTAFRMDEQKAIDWYWRVIGNNKGFFLIIGFLILFSCFFCIILSHLTKYLNQIEKGINNIVSDSEESIQMISELQPIESRLKDIKRTLNKQKQDALEAEKKKNDLVVYLAHDLKTPLTSIVAYLTMLDSYEDMPEEERERYTHVALEKSVRLGELINEFFDITKFNLQDIELEKQELNLSMMLEQVADEFYGVFREKNLVCQVEAEEDLKVNGDADKLARVFENILRNAVSYCYRDSVIRIEAVRVEKGSQITFSNRGNQIPPEKLESIFEKFYRLDDARASATGGAGLGLAIAKKIVELHGGEIKATSDEEETHFIVTLPEEVTGEEDEIYSHSGRPSRGRARRIKGRK